MATDSPASPADPGGTFHEWAREQQRVLDERNKTIRQLQMEHHELKSALALLQKRNNELENNSKLNNEAQRSPSIETLHMEFPKLPNNRNTEKSKSQKSKTPAKRFKPTTQEEIETSNRFEALSDLHTTEDAEEEMEVVKKNPTHTQKDKPKNIHPNAKIVPIVIRERSKWQMANKLFREKEINYVKAKVVPQGISVEPATEDDYRKMYKELKDKVDFYSYQLKSEKELKIVIRGIYVEATTEEIAADLTDQGYPPSKVIRMNGKGGYPAPMALIHIDKKYDSIYKTLKHCCNVSVQLEPLKQRPGVIQCHKCQLFGHSQKNCWSKYKCMKCAEEHSTHLCTKPSTTEATCANCQGRHISTSTNCPNNPNNPKNRPPTREQKWQPAPPPSANYWSHRKEMQPPLPAQPLTVQDIPPIRREPTPHQTKDSEELALILGRMAISFSETNATKEQQLVFLGEQRKLIQLFNRNTK